MKFSIIIPTYNRSESLKNTIKSLMKIDYPKNNYEIIVVDNNSSDGTKKVVEELIRMSNIKIKYLFERKLGVMYARHMGARNAAGKFLYFVDDDVLVTKPVLREFEKIFKMNGRIACVTGKIKPRWWYKPPSWILKYFNNHILSLNNNRREKLLVSQIDVGVFSCHQAIRKPVLFHAGGFNPEATGNTWIGDGETGLNIKIEKLGYLFCYTDKAIVYHVIPKERMTQRYINHRYANQGRAQSSIDLKKMRGDKLKFVLYLCYYFLELIINCILTPIYLPFSNKWHLKMAYVFYYSTGISFYFKFVFDSRFRRLALKEKWL